MKGTKSASRYAKALLELAIENNQIDAIASDMKALVAANEETRDFHLFLVSPIINAEKKTLIFKELFPQFNEITSSFVTLVTKNGRESLLPIIASSFEMQLKAHLGIVPVTLVSAQPMDAATKTSIMNKVQAAVSGKLEVEEKIDASIVGGFIVKMGDTQIDASIANQFKNLKQRLTR